MKELSQKYHKIIKQYQADLKTGRSIKLLFPDFQVIYYF